MKTCNKCGGQIEKDDAKFCVHCGMTFAPEAKKAQRGGMAITGLCLPLFLVLIYFVQDGGEMIRTMYFNENALLVGSIVMLLANTLGLFFSIMGAKNCHGVLKVLSIIGIVVNCIVFMIVIINIMSASAATGCV